MHKLGKKFLASLAAGAALLVATPASAGIVVFYYSDYVGGTPAGYQIYCDSGYLLEQWGNVSTGILIYHHQDVGC